MTMILFISIGQRMDSQQSVDTHSRYIYIHGTNDLANLGKPVSHGCVRMDPDEVIDLFGQVAEGTFVYIYKA